MWDSHLHCHFSGDSSAKPQDIIEAATQAGLSGICFTDHMDIDYPPDPEEFLLDIPSYYKEISSLQKEYKDRLKIHFGMELGLQPHLAATHKEIVSSYPFDFIIGSSHLVHGFDPYYPEFFQNRNERDAYLEYFQSILENLNACDSFDVYGHIDYVVRYGPNKNQFYSYAAYADIIDEILKALIAKGKGIELNTGGFKYGLGHPNPTEDVIKRYRELGGEIITVGSDAHVPEHIAYDFSKAAVILKVCGFRYYTVFTARKPEFFPVD